jgi:hypothetical protein
MSAAQDDLDSAIARAVSSLDTAIIENRLHDDPLRHILVALIVFLKAQRRLYATADQDLATHLEDARQPVQDDQLRRAVMQGIAAHATKAIDALNLRTAFWLVVSGVAFGLVGFGLGGWWQYDRMAAQVDRMAAAVEIQDRKTERIIVDAKELGNVALSAKSAATWTDLVRLNPNVAEELRGCQPLKQPSGSACLLPIWLLPPPPQVQTPATH